MSKAARRRDEQGVAFIIVLAVLLALMVLAGPFLQSAEDESSASGTVLAKARARAQARGRVAWARARLQAGHRASERLLEGGSPDWDMPEELAVPAHLLDDQGRPLLDPEGVPLLFDRDPKGAIASLRVRDANTLPNLLSAPPQMVAWALGRSVLAGDITKDDTDISVEDGRGFPEKKGVLNIAGEVIPYELRVGDTFQGCQRGAEGGLRARAHAEEDVVFDDRARQIAMLPYRSPRANGGWREPTTGTYIKEIALTGEHALTPVEVDRVLARFSVAGMRWNAGGFGPAVKVRRDLDPDAFQGQGFNVQVTSNEGFTPGTVVRITDGVNTEYGMVARSRGGFGFATLTLYDATQHAYTAASTDIAPLLRHPINLNAVSEETLVAVLEGLHSGFQGRGAGKLGRVTESAAKIFADRLRDRRPIKDFKELRKALEEIVKSNPLRVNGLQATAIFRNAVNPNDRNMLQSSVPFAFRSFDHYLIEGSSSINDGGGRQLARHRVRERVRVAPPGLLEEVLDTQEQFEVPIIRTRSAKWTTTHPLPVARWTSDTAIPSDRVPRMLNRFGGNIFGGGGGGDEEEQDVDAEKSGRDGLFPDKQKGDVRLLPARQGSDGYNEHMDGPAGSRNRGEPPLYKIDPEGWKLEEGPFEINPTDRRGTGVRPQLVRDRGSNRFRRRGRSQNRGALTGRINANPVRFDMWYYTGSAAGGRQVVFDLAGQDPDEDRVNLVIEGDGTLRGRVHGRTLDDQSDGVEDVAETFWTPPSGGFWQRNTWYHLGLAYRGTRPEDVLLFVDGFQRGRPRYLTHLTAALKDDDDSFSVEDAEGWPDRGVALVGSEVIAFERSGNNFDVVGFQNTAAGTMPWGRGRRGTRARGHAIGTPVSIFGYSALPRGIRRNVRDAIPAGGGALRASVGPMAVATFQKNFTVTLPPPGPNQNPITLDVHDPSRAGGDVLELDVASIPTTGSLDAFPSTGGYILIVSVGVQLPGGFSLPAGFEQMGGIEFAYYSRRSGNRLIGVSAPLRIPNPSLAAQAPAIGAGAGNTTGEPPIFTDRLIHPVRMAGAVNLAHLSCVFPISLAVNSVSGYAKPRPARAADWDTHPEFVQIGDPDLADLDNHDVEWVRYHHIDDTGHLLCDEVLYLRRTAQRLQAMLIGGTLQSIDWRTNALYRDLLFPFRFQGQTWRLTDGVHSAGGQVVPCFRTESYTRRSSINIGGSNFPPADPNGPNAPTSGAPMSPCGWGDVVTLEDRNGTSRKNFRVSWAGRDTYGEPGLVITGTGIPDPPNYDGHGWIAFTESPGRAYRQRFALPGDGGPTRRRSDYMRLLKFPSGELPLVARQARAFAGGDIDGAVASADGRIDELRVTPFEGTTYIVWDHDDLQFSTPDITPPGGVSAEADEIPVATVEWLLSAYSDGDKSFMLPDGRRILVEKELQNGGRQGTPVPREDAGLVRIDEEIIAFRRIGSGSGGAPALLECVRGFMNTVPAEHGYGASVVFLDFIPVTRLNNALDERGRLIEVASGGGFERAGGTLLIDDEMIHFTEARQRQFTMPARIDDQGEEVGGLFRGRFGTRPQDHDGDAIVLWMPHRYWDRYAEEQDSAEMSFYGFSLDLPGAFFHRIAWDEYRPGDRVDIRVLCRTEGDVRWSAPPGAGLLQFDDSGQDDRNLIDRSGSRLDVRVMYRFLSGAFNASNMEAHDWKRTPELRSIRVEYLDETRVLQREESR